MDSLLVKKPKVEENYFSLAAGDEDVTKLGLIFSIVLLVLCSLLFLMSRGILSMIFLGFSTISVICMVIQSISFCMRNRQTDLYLTFLFFNEIQIWFGAVIVFYLIGTVKSFLFPLFIAASSKGDWDNSYWSYMSYEVYMGLFITFIPVLLIACICLIGNNIYNYHMNEGTVEEIADRTLGAVVILELLITFSFAILLKFEGIWNTYYFAVMLYILLGISIIFFLLCLYFGFIRKGNNPYEDIQVYLYFFFIFMLVFHIVMAIIVFSEPTNLKSNNPTVFSINYDEGFLKKYFNEEKYLFKGNEDQIADCPQYFSVYAWEDSENTFGCINMKAYYQGREIVCLLLDIIIILPLFDALLLYSFFDIGDNLGDSMKENGKYIKCQEKMRMGLSWLISGGIVVGTIFILCWDNFTKSSKFIKNDIEALSLSNDALKPMIIPSLTTNDNDLYELSNRLYNETRPLSNNEVIKYTIQGKINTIHSKYTVIFKPLKGGEEIQKEYNSNEDFIVELPGDTKSLTKYHLTIKTNAVTLEFGDIVIGGLITGKTIKLGTIPIDPKIQHPMTNITGMILNPKRKDKYIENAKVYLIKGYRHYPSEESDLDTSKSFIVKDAFKSMPTYYNGRYIFFQLPQGYYTLVVSKDGYYVETVHFSTDGSSLSFEVKHIYLTPIDSQLPMEVLFSYTGAIELDLMTSFKISQETKCSISYLNNECGNGKQTSTSRSEDGIRGLEMISFDAIGDFNYEFIVHKYHLETVDFMKNHFAKGFWDEEVYLNSPMDITESKGEMKVYIPKYRFPLLNAFVPMKKVPLEKEGMTWDVFRMKVTNRNLDFTINDSIR